MNERCKKCRYLHYGDFVCAVCNTKDMIAQFRTGGLQGLTIGFLLGGLAGASLLGLCLKLRGVI